jgi:hypothetical protein
MSFRSQADDWYLGCAVCPVDGLNPTVGTAAIAQRTMGRKRRGRRQVGEQLFIFLKMENLIAVKSQVAAVFFVFFGRCVRQMR